MPKKIIVIVYSERDKFTGRSIQVVSHGYDIETDQVICMPQIDVRLMEGVKMDYDLGEYTMELNEGENTE